MQEGNRIHHKPLQMIKTNAYIYLHRVPNCLYTVTIKGREQGFTQVCQWAMAPSLEMVQPMALKAQNQNCNELHNQNKNYTKPNVLRNTL